jgi:hypothetical protein
MFPSIWFQSLVCCFGQDLNHVRLFFVDGPSIAIEHHGLGRVCFCDEIVIFYFKLLLS